uniref:Uncharacterized protein n=1 Tax=Opuntia streptacantha TaxID=393608 RepID=A0A7C8ZJA2_OPUST
MEVEDMDEKEVEITEENPSPLVPPPSSSSGHFKLFDKMELLEFKDKYIIKALDSSQQGFSISRFDGDIQPLNSGDSLGTPDKTSTIFGVIGTIRLIAGLTSFCEECSFG